MQRVPLPLSNALSLSLCFCPLLRAANDSLAAISRGKEPVLRGVDAVQCPLTLAPGAATTCKIARGQEPLNSKRVSRKVTSTYVRTYVRTYVAIPASCVVPVPPCRFAPPRLVTSRYTGKSGM